VARNYGIPEELVVLLEDLYSKLMSAVRVDGELTEWFRVIVGVRQGCNFSPHLFNLLLEAMMSVALKTIDTGVSLNVQAVNNLRFVDDIDLNSSHQRNYRNLQMKFTIAAKDLDLK